MRAATAIASLLLVGSVVGLENPHRKAKAVQRAHQHKTVLPRAVPVARDDDYKYLTNKTES